MQVKLIFGIILLIVTATITSCEKDITVDLPQPEERLVVEGIIEEGKPPYVIITKNTPYFSQIDLSTLGKLIVGDALVTVSNGTETDTLDFAFTPNEFPFVRYMGDKFVGESGKRYNLSITYNSELFEASTTIPATVPFDSTVFRVETNADADSLGYIWLYYSDPADRQNYYRMYTKTEGKDSLFVHPFASIVDDKLTNGQQIVYPIYRGGMTGQGAAPTDTVETDRSDADFMFKAGETVLLKLCTMDGDHYKFWQSFEQHLMSAGNPFAAPSDVYTNISGGAMGIWGGYGVHIDTLLVEMPDAATKKAPQ